MVIGPRRQRSMLSTIITGRRLLSCRRQHRYEPDMNMISDVRHRGEMAGVAIHMAVYHSILL